MYCKYHYSRVEVPIGLIALDNCNNMDSNSSMLCKYHYTRVEVRTGLLALDIV